MSDVILIEQRLDLPGDGYDHDGLAAEPMRHGPIDALWARFMIRSGQIVSISIDAGQDMRPGQSRATSTTGPSSGETDLWSGWWSQPFEWPVQLRGIPVEATGTGFQRTVWQALRATRAGEQLSYSELAARVGQPRAVRAVASACAANPCALWTPCHRIVRRDGTLGGYRWGIGIKRRLLDAERRVAHDRAPS